MRGSDLWALSADCCLAVEGEVIVGRLTPVRELQHLPPKNVIIEDKADVSDEGST